MSERLSEESSFDAEMYMKFTEHDTQNPQEVLDIRERYGDSRWGTHRETLVGDRQKFTGPTPGPTQRYRRNKQEAGYFFDLFWDQATIGEIVRQTNIYAGQAHRR